MHATRLSFSPFFIKILLVSSFILFFVFVSFCCPSGNELVQVESNQWGRVVPKAVRSGYLIRYPPNNEKGRNSSSRFESRAGGNGRYGLIERDSTANCTDDNNNNNSGRPDDKPAAHDLFTVTEEDICVSIYDESLSQTRTHTTKYVTKCRYTMHSRIA